MSMLRNTRLFTIATVLALPVAAAANAGSIKVDGLGGDVKMKSKAMESLFGADSPNFSDAALASVHDELNSAGINTEGKVTFLLAETDSGLSFVTLVDGPGGDRNNFQSHFGGANTQLGMTTTAPSTTSPYVNDNQSDIDLFLDGGNGMHTAAGEFTWDSNAAGDGFAWAGLSDGDYSSFNFFRGGSAYDSFPGLDSSDTFQFLSWNGESWDIVASDTFSQAGMFAFSFTVVPLPAPVLMGLAGLGVVAALRRRRSVA